MRHSLTLIGVAHKAQHGADGLLYHHTFNTMTDDIVFRDTVHARRWLKAMNDGQACNEMASDSYRPSVYADLT
jgi:hypothetical protein